jgi:hypothetical protein
MSRKINKAQTTILKVTLFIFLFAISIGCVKTKPSAAMPNPPIKNSMVRELEPLFNNIVSYFNIPAIEHEYNKILKWSNTLDPSVVLEIRI